MKNVHILSSVFLAAALVAATLSSLLHAARVAAVRAAAKKMKCRCMLLIALKGLGGGNYAPKGLSVMML